MGSALLSREAARGISESFVADDFYRPSHQDVFRAIAHLVSVGREVDLITVGEHFPDKVYLAELASSVTVSSSWSSYVGIIKTDRKLRDFIERMTHYIGTAYGATDDSIVAEATGELVSMQDRGDKNARNLADLVAKRIEDYKTPTEYIMAVASQVKLHYGDLTIIAGRPGAGKTAYALACADAWSKRHEVAFFTFEMSADELTDRFVSRETGLSVEFTYDGLSDSEAQLFRDKVGALKDRKLSIKECSGMSEKQLAASLTSFAHRCKGKGVAVIDYLQIAYEMTRAGENADLTRLSKMLRRTAKSTGIAIIALSQFSRDGDGEDDKKPVFPRLKHLRGSGSLEQDAANVCLMYAFPPKESEAGSKARQELQPRLAADLNDGRDLIRLHWAKVRHGKREIGFALFDGDNMSYEEVDERT